MNPIQRLRRFAAVVAGLAAALVASGAAPAFASLPPGLRRARSPDRPTTSR
jgi:hypothetical protein